MEEMGGAVFETAKIGNICEIGGKMRQKYKQKWLGGENF